MAWAVVLTAAFRHECRKLNSEIRERIEATVQELASSEDPRKLGHRLHGRFEGLYSYEMGRQYRIIYGVDLGKKVIEFLAAGTHKVYR